MPLSVSPPAASPRRASPHEPWMRAAMFKKAAGRLGRFVVKLPGQVAVAANVPPAWTGYRWVRHETLERYIGRCGGAAGAMERIHAPMRARNPLPCNVPGREALSKDRGWFGFSFHDVPQRESAETFLAELHDTRISTYRDAARNVFHPALLTPDDRALDMRQARFRPPHGRALDASPRPLEVEHAVWILERAYDNHSHWLTAHLPKLILLEALGRLDRVLLPQRRTPVIDETLELAGFDPSVFLRFDEDRSIRVQRLTVVGADRFRPELLCPVRMRFALPPRPRTRRLFISRARAASRRLVNEDALWPKLAAAGFEKVFFEELDFKSQLALMAETEIVLGPHGAGLTNMLFCPAGAQIVEIADPEYPNPNFYALACALGHRYWLIEGRGVGAGHPLGKDLYLAEEALTPVLQALGDPA